MVSVLSGVNVDPEKLQNYGHPAEDWILLVTSAVLLIGAMMAAFFWWGSRVPARGSVGEYGLIFLLLALAACLTWFSNRILRIKRCRKDPHS
jgi:hypothetical protein